MLTAETRWFPEWCSRIARTIRLIDIGPMRRLARRSTGGKRIATGTYRLDKLSGGGTRVNFEYSWQQAPFSERLAAPIVRESCAPLSSARWERLAEQLNAASQLVESP